MKFFIFLLTTFLTTSSFTQNLPDDRNTLKNYTQKYPAAYNKRMEKILEQQVNHHNPPSYPLDINYKFDQRQQPFSEFSHEYPCLTAAENSSGFSNSFSSEIQCFSDSVRIEWVNHYGSGELSSNEGAMALVLDTLGNIYISGNSLCAMSGYDFLTLKYDRFGNLIWYVRFDGPDNSSDWVYAIAVDEAGNVYVAGKSWCGYSYDLTIVKYSTDGEQQWFAQYNGSGNGEDEPVALAVDNSGNVYVVGSSDGLNTGLDYVTIKYNPDGNEEWVTRYNGPGNERDIPSGLKIDKYNNIIVTGGSYGGSETDLDYTTIKYNSAGAELWVKRYNGNNDKLDFASALEIDNQGNIYITGWTYVSEFNLTDFLTIKYDSNGVVQWVAQYDDFYDYRYSDDWATAITVDDSSNVYITGESYWGRTHTDYLTMKYNSNGIKQWVRGYDYECGYDEPLSVITDDSCNVYVTGECGKDYSGCDFVTIKYNSTGVVQWIKPYNGSSNGTDYPTGFAINKFGDLVVSGASYGGDVSLYDYLTICYDSAGNVQWLDRYESENNSMDQAVALAIDANENIYVVGKSESSNTFDDFAIVKYSASGTQQWNIRYNGPADKDDNPKAIAVDNYGNVYVAGNSEGLTTGLDYVTIKYNSEGVKLWESRYNGSANGSDKLYDMAIDDFGNVYVTGCSETTEQNFDFATLKYNSEGVEQWVQRYEGASGRGTYALEIDFLGNVHITGPGEGSNSNVYYQTIKYNADGVEQWAVRLDGPGNYPDSPADIKVDWYGNVYVTGSGYFSDNENDYLTIKYNSNGIEQWKAFYNGPENSLDFATALALDDNGDIIVSGYCRNNDYYEFGNYTTVKYNSDGARQWVAMYSDTTDYFNDATSVAVDFWGNVYVTGSDMNSSTNKDYITIKYNVAGEEQWIARFDSRQSINIAEAIAVDNSANVYITGSTGWNYSSRVKWSIFTTIKYSQFPGINNSPPQIASEPETIAWRDSLYSYQPVVIDVDGDKLDYYLLVAPKWLSIDHTTGLIKGIPTQNNIGDTVVVLNVSDSYGFSAKQGFALTIQAVDIPPVFTDLPDSLIIEPDSARTLPVWNYVEDIETPDSLLIFDFVVSNEALIFNYNETNGYLVLSVKENFSGKAFLAITVRDEAQNAISDTIPIIVPPPTGLKLFAEHVPKEYILLQNSPNPFNPSTLIRFGLPNSTRVRIDIYSVLGHFIEFLLDEYKSAGYHVVCFDAGHLSSGIYFYKISAGEFREVKKMMLIK